MTRPATDRTAGTIPDAPITQDYLEAKIAEAHRLRAETLSAMVSALFRRRPAEPRPAPYGTAREA